MDNLKILKSQIFNKHGVLAKIYSQSAQKSLVEYADDWPISLASDYTKIFFGRVQKLLLCTYSSDLVDGALSEVALKPLVSTIDHHGILNHPFFINSNLIYSQKKQQKYLLCLSTAGVSLNNSSWPGCLLLTGQDGQMRRFSFFPDKIKTQTVLAAKGFTPNDVERVCAHIRTTDFLPKDEKERLIEMAQEIFQDPKLFKFSKFSNQASLVSTALWQKVFPSAPRLLYLPLEELINEILINEIAPHQDHLLYRLFFTIAGWDVIEKYFRGSLGAFSGGHKGSFLFWAITGNLHRAHLFRKGSEILTEGRETNGQGSASVYSSAGDIIEGLSNNTLYPTSLVCFLVLLYYDITCLGGFNQVNWLTGIKEKFIELLKEWGEKNLAERIAKIPTENFSEGTLAFCQNRQGEIYKPTGLDLLLQNDPGLYEKYREGAFKITLGESIDAQLPEIYKVITPANQRESRLLNITENDILNNNGMADKIKSIFTE